MPMEVCQIDINGLLWTLKVYFGALMWTVIPILTVCLQLSWLWRTTGKGSSVALVLIDATFIHSRDGRYLISSPIPVPILVSLAGNQRYRYRYLVSEAKVSVIDTDTDSIAHLWNRYGP